MRDNKSDKINGILSVPHLRALEGDQTGFKSRFLIVHNLAALAVSENKQNALIIKLEKM
jgi:hypothetical protein